MRFTEHTFFSLLSLAAILVLASCGGKQSESAPSELPAAYADFPEFYERFHTDSAFQMAHIQFPLMGKSDTGAWQAKEWLLHRPVDFSRSDFTREIAPIGDDILVERIVHKMGDFRLVRRWARLDEDWFLIYYAEQSPPSTPPARDSGALRIDGGFGE
jgi:hypothetical protein